METTKVDFSGITLKINLNGCAGHYLLIDRPKNTSHDMGISLWNDLGLVQSVHVRLNTLRDYDYRVDFPLNSGDYIPVTAGITLMSQFVVECQLIVRYRDSDNDHFRGTHSIEIEL